MIQCKQSFGGKMDKPEHCITYIQQEWHWKKKGLYKKAEEHKIELNMLNSIIGSKNIEKDFEQLMSFISNKNASTKRFDFVVKFVQ